MNTHRNKPTARLAVLTAKKWMGGWMDANTGRKTYRRIQELRRQIQ